MFKQVPPWRQGFDWHSSTSSEHVGPSNPFGQLQLKFPMGNDVQVPPLRHGDEAHRFCFSQCFPVSRNEKVKISNGIVTFSWTPPVHQFVCYQFLPVYPCAQEQLYLSSDFKLHVPPCWQGDESHAFFSCISHNEAVNPMGHVHVKTGVPSLKLTVHVPPFWHLGPGPVWHGFGYWQNSPTYREEQLKIIIRF